MAPGDSDPSYRCNGCGSIQRSEIGIRQHCMGCAMSKEQVAKGQEPFTKMIEREQHAPQLKKKSGQQLSEEKKIARRLHKKNEAVKYRLRKKEEARNLYTLLGKSARYVGFLLAENEQLKRRVEQLEAEKLAKTSEKDQELAQIIQDLENTSSDFMNNQEGESSSSPTKAQFPFFETGSSGSIEKSSSQDELLFENAGNWDFENFTEDSIDLDFFTNFFND